MFAHDSYWSDMKESISEYLDRKIPEVSDVTRQEIACYITGSTAIRYYDFIETMEKERRRSRVSHYVDYYQKDRTSQEG